MTAFLLIQDIVLNQFLNYLKVNIMSFHHKKIKLNEFFVKL